MSFDKAAKTWDDSPTKVERSRVLSQIIIDFVEGKNINKALEFGCGTGLLSFFMKEIFHKITLADTSIGMIDVLKEKIELTDTSNFKPMLISENGATDFESYDIIYSLLTLHHIEDLMHVFNLFSKIVAPGGYLFIADLVKEDGDFHSKDSGDNLHHGFDKDYLVNDLEKYGFTFVKYQLFYTIKKTTDGGEVKEFPLFLLIVKKNTID